MSTATTSISPETSAARTTGAEGSSVKRIAALAAFETRMLARNSVALFVALLVPPAMVISSWWMIDDGSRAGGMTAGIISFNIAFTLVFAVFYNHTTASVARREELTLKRLLTGSCCKTEILLAMAVPPMLIVLAQTLIVTVVASIAFGMPPLTNPVLVLLAVIAGGVICALLSYACSGVTKTVDAAQLTTLPYILVGLLLSGLLLPLPDSSTISFFFQASPMWGFVEVMKIGLTGVSFEAGQVDFAESWLRAIYPSLNIVFWILVGILLVRRYMVWEPRR